MNAFRVARAARPAFNALRTVQRRGYADVAADKIQLSLALPHQVRARRLENGSLLGIEEGEAGEKKDLKEEMGVVVEDAGMGRETREFMGKVCSETIGG